MIEEKERLKQISRVWKKTPENLYLDTNIIHGWFEKNVERFKTEKNPEIYSTKIMDWLYKSKRKLFVSTLAKAEIFRFLHSSYGVDKDTCIRMWERFKKIHNIREVKITKFEINIRDFIEIASKVALGKKTFINIMHIQIAKSLKLTFLTGDIRLDKIKFYYKKILDYPSLRKLYERDFSTF